MPKVYDVDNEEREGEVFESLIFHLGKNSTINLMITINYFYT